MTIASSINSNDVLINNFDGGNPLFLHANDNSSMSIINFNTILAKDPLPNVKDPFNIVSREESQRGLHPDVSCGNNVSFVVKTNNNANNSYRKVNNNNNNNNSNRGLNPNMLCKNCGLIDHTVERCYELISYLVGFKKNSTLLIPIE
ncbi:hypothetical protein Tco_0713149 [Tanacetum coccineum]